METAEPRAGKGAGPPAPVPAFLMQSGKFGQEGLCLGHRARTLHRKLTCSLICTVRSAELDSAQLALIPAKKPPSSARIRVEIDVRRGVVVADPNAAAVGERRSQSSLVDATQHEPTRTVWTAVAIEWRPTSGPQAPGQHKSAEVLPAARMPLYST